MSGGNWSALDLTADPVRGEPGDVRSLANAVQQEAARWEQQAQALRSVANEGSAVQMDGDFAPKARQVLQAHPNEATPLARGRKDAAQALLAYASALEQAKRTSQQALARGTQARQTYRQAQMVRDQCIAQMNAFPRVVPAPQYPYVLQQFNMLRARAQQASQAMQQAEMQWKMARQQAVTAGQQAAQQERAAAERVLAAAPKATASSGGGGGSGIGNVPAATGGRGRVNGDGSGSGSGAAGSTGTAPPATGRRQIEGPPARLQIEAPARNLAGGSLNAHEGLPTNNGNSAGHTIDRHVGRPDDYLRQRLADQPNQDRMSSYTTPTEANRYVDRALEINRDDIDAWLDNPGSGPRLSFNTQFPNEDIGRVLERGAVQSGPGHGIQLALERRPPGSDPPYLVVTSYPTP